MTPFGHTRTILEFDHAFISPAGHVKAPMPGWTDTQCIVLISPQMGSSVKAQFTQYLALMDRGGVGAPPPAGIQRFAYVIEGAVEIEVGGDTHLLNPGGYAYLPAESDYAIRATKESRLNLFEKRYHAQEGLAQPDIVIGQEQNVEAAPFMGDPSAMLKTLLPTDEPFDMAVNLFTFAPGAALPFVEMHVMEHGMIMLQGGGIYRLNERWYPIQEGDVLWMGPYCPQWFGALGKTPSRYLYYKDANRHPLG